MNGMSSASLVSVQSSVRIKRNILHYLSSKGGYKNLDQISKQVTRDSTSAEQATRELLTLGMVKQSSEAGKPAGFKIVFKGELAIASLLHISLFALIGVITLLAAVSSLSNISIAGLLLAATFGLFGYTFITIMAKRSLH
jgi:predicted MarR family transcription regulator